MGAGAGGDWAGWAGRIALRQAGQWLPLLPCDGMQVLDRARGQILHHIAGVWRAPALPAVASGGTVIDAQARQAIAALVAALQQWGVFPA